ncbi:MAG: serine/threonine protein kinase [Deltaproteobacteria bacterium]|nr:serine/threonine protein kinase [Deltaproteobacteria bacterium]
MASRPLILVCPNAGIIGSTLVRRRDLELAWALTPAEANAVLTTSKVDLVLLRESHAKAVLDAQPPSLADDRTRFAVLLEEDGWSRKDHWLTLGATAVVSARQRRELEAVISELTGLAFSRHLRAPVAKVVRVMSGSFDATLETHDVSVSGVSVVDLPPGKLGSAVRVRFDFLPNALSALVVRYFAVHGRSAAGLSFLEVTDEERVMLEHAVKDANVRARAEVPPEFGDPVGDEFGPPTGEFDAPSMTAELPKRPPVPAIDTVRGVLAGAAAEGGPEWLVELAKGLTSSEKREALGEPAPAWARPALEGRLKVQAARSRAGDRNLSRSEFREVFELCETLARMAQNDPPQNLVEVTEIRAGLLRGLYGVEKKPHKRVEVRGVVLGTPSQPPPPPASIPPGDDVIERAEDLLRRGDIRGAADLYRSRNFLKQAIQLYLNVLDLPGEAAPLIARLGDHQRAADLYSLAGAYEKAAQELVRVARLSPRPELFVPRLNRLSSETGLQFLEEITRRRPLGDETVELWYLFALALERVEDSARSRAILEQIRDRFAGYKDVVARLDAQLAPEPRPSVAPTWGLTTPLPAAPVPGWSEHPTWDEETGSFRAPAELLTHGDIDVVAREAAAAAARQGAVAPGRIEVDRSRPVSSAGRSFEVASADAPIVRGAIEPIAPGLYGAFDDAPLDSVLLDPMHVRTALENPVVALRARLSNRRVNAESVDDFNLLAQAELVAGHFDAAALLFDKINTLYGGVDISGNKAEAIRRWQSEIASRTTRLAVSGFNEDNIETRYVLRGELGRGKHAAVYCAKDRTDDREVSLKVFRPDYVAGWKNRRPVFDRLQKIAKVDHPNVATVLDVGEVDGRAFVASEYVPGTLAAVLHVRHRLSVVESLRLAMRLSAALVEIHAAKLVHGNIKPENVLFDPLGIVKLTDFWLPVSDPPSEISGESELAYRSAAQLAGTLPAPTDDIFAVGVLLYRLIIGRFPYAGLERRKLPESLASATKARPGWLDALVLRALHPEPSVRYRGASELSSTLGHILTAVGSARSDAELPSRLEDQRPSSAERTPPPAILSKPVTPPPPVISTEGVPIESVDILATTPLGEE